MGSAEADVREERFITSLGAGELCDMRRVRFMLAAMTWAAAVVSLAACLCVSVLWVRSYSATDEFALHYRSGCGWLRTDAGDFVFARARFKSPTGGALGAGSRS